MIDSNSYDRMHNAARFAEKEIWRLGGETRRVEMNGLTTMDTRKLHGPITISQHNSIVKFMTDRVWENRIPNIPSYWQPKG